MDAFSANGAAIPRVDLTAEELGRADVTLVVTAHRVFDFELIADESRLILDTRNALWNHPGDNVVRL